MKVRAMKTGYYNLLRRKEGEEFELKEIKGLDRDGKPLTLKAEDQFSDKWMEKCDGAYSAKKNQTKKPSNHQSSDAEVI